MLALRRSCRWIAVCFAAFGCDGDSPLAPGSAVNGSVGAGSSPAAPSNTNAATASHTQVNISWQDNSANESGFEVHRSTTGASGAFSLLVSTGANATSYNDGGLTAASQYCYKVLAFRILGGKGRSSGFSNT
ncbi:MAG TPA: fibronectin type III domain-containing protein, partial [Gemmatimonadales bacterium]|nr:fibronectin type III domain-containing protein [Gemmatimonadales bacterium]